MRKTIKVYIPIKKDSHIKGYWKDKDKVYIDNINIIQCNKDSIQKHKNILFNDKKQLAIFYSQGNKAYIENRQGDITILKHCIRYTEKHITRDYIKALLVQHGGLTIYKYRGYYTIEIWKN